MSSINSLSSSAQRPSPSAYETMTSEDFLRVMFTELTRQDPTKPTDSKDLLDQLGSIRSIESDTSLSKRLETMAKQNELGAASNVVGAFVTGRTAEGKDVRGFVDSIRVTREGVMLNLSTGSTIAFSSLEEVYDPTLISTTPAEEGEEEEDSARAASTASTERGAPPNLLELLAALEGGAGA